MNWRLAALLLFVAGAAQAEADVYRYYIHHSGPASKIEWSNPGAGWDVTVGFDSEHCAIYCAYRRIRDGFGPVALTHFLLPPPTVIRVYRDPSSAPETLTVDPAGLRHPRLDCCDGACPSQSGIPGRGFASWIQPVDSQFALARPNPVRLTAQATPRALPAAAPLRI